MVSKKREVTDRALMLFTVVFTLLLLQGCALHSSNPRQVLDNAYQTQESLVEISLEASSFLNSYLSNLTDGKKLANRAVILEDQLAYQMKILKKGVAGEYTEHLVELGKRVKNLIDYLKMISRGGEHKEEDLEKLLQRIVDQNNAITDIMREEAR